MSGRNLERVRRAIRAHYGLARRVTDAEVEAELRNLVRKSRLGALDDFGERLYSRVGMGDAQLCGLADYLAAAELAMCWRNGVESWPTIGYAVTAREVLS